MTASQPNILQPRRSRTAIKTLEENLSRTNALPTSDFAEAYLPPGWSTWTHPKTQEAHTLTLHRPDELEEAEFQACFELIDQTSGDDYRNSSAGWSEAGKKREMKSHGLRYVLVRRASSPTTTIIAGFTSFMPTFEDGQPVLYIYEIHLVPSLQGSGSARTSCARSCAPSPRGSGTWTRSCSRASAATRPDVASTTGWASASTRAPPKIGG